MNIVKLGMRDLPLFEGANLLRAVRELAGLSVTTPFREWAPLARICLTLIPRYTMVLPRRLLSLRHLVEDLETRGISGDIVECGSWNGGSAALMGLYGSRKVWVFDSFEGLPEPGENDGEWERKHYFKGWSQGDPAKVREAFRKLGVPTERFEIVKGWFDRTLPGAPIRSISLLHVDADWYESVKTVLETLYAKVERGGFVVLDDYGRFEGCRKAFDEFNRAREGGRLSLVKVDSSAYYFRRP
jgi:O-methyltransferase